MFFAVSRAVKQVTYCLYLRQSNDFLAYSEGLRA
jgi:hypothetical protein